MWYVARGQATKFFWGGTELKFADKKVWLLKPKGCGIILGTPNEYNKRMPLKEMTNS